MKGGFKVIYNPDETELSLAVLKTHVPFQRNRMEEIFKDNKSNLGTDAWQYTLSLRRDFEEELIKTMGIEAYYKHYESIREKGLIRGIDFFIQNESSFSYFLNGSVGNAYENGKPLTGSIDWMVQLGMGYNFEKSGFFSSIRSQAGYWTNTDTQLESAFILDMGYYQNFNLFNESDFSVRATVNNVLGTIRKSPLIAYRVDDKDRVIDVPVTVFIQAEYNGLLNKP
jgi:hypothetical protein